MKMLTGNIFRIIYAGIFSIIGINHIVNASEFAKYFPSYIPDSKDIVLIIGFILIAASVFILLNKFVKPICISLSIFLLVVVFAIHLPGLLNIEIMKTSMFNVLKDTGLAGGGLLIAGIFDVSEHN
ncbi:MAG TPA: DoxX family membrane protein [Ignavibacteriaceae bacterium]|nr:DoxX family membrane protein [Ignavibacteriaceae bacterium]